jgi:hypothetical protein
MNHRMRWGRLTVSALSALGLGVLGFMAFLQGIHDPTTLQKILQTIGLPLFEIGAEAGLFWIAIIASVVLWTVVLYVALTVYAAPKHDRPAA